MKEILINLDTELAGDKPMQGIKPGDTVSWRSSQIDGIVEVKFHPFQEPPKLRDNIVSQDAARGRYFYRVFNNGKDIGGGVMVIPGPPDRPAGA